MAAGNFMLLRLAEDSGGTAGMERTNGSSPMEPILPEARRGVERGEDGLPVQAVMAGRRSGEAGDDRMSGMD